MDPKILGKKYDKIAGWWHDQHNISAYGVEQIRRAVRYSRNHGAALDVGCGGGGRIVRLLLEAGFSVTGLDVSEEMIRIAKSNHPDQSFFVADICEWTTNDQYDLIVAWDSLFHLPLAKHADVVSKLCAMLRPNGILIYTLGDDQGEHETTWHNDQFYYSTIGIDENLKVIMANGCHCRHVELDQYPQKHCFVIAEKRD